MPSGTPFKALLLGVTLPPSFSLSLLLLPSFIFLHSPYPSLVMSYSLQQSDSLVQQATAPVQYLPLRIPYSPYDPPDTFVPLYGRRPASQEPPPSYIDLMVSNYLLSSDPKTNQGQKTVDYRHVDHRGRGRSSFALVHSFSSPFAYFCRTEHVFYAFSRTSLRKTNLKSLSLKSFHLHPPLLLPHDLPLPPLFLLDRSGTY
jgi:hypothetical protein